MFGTATYEAEVQRAEERVAELCGVLNATTAALVSQIGHVLEIGLWEGAGIRSPEHWVMLHCGVAPRRARSLVAMARRLPELPETQTSFEAGVLSEDQTRLVVRHAPGLNDGEVSELARHCTVPQLQRVLSGYPFVEPAPAEAEPAPPPEEIRRVGFHFDEDGSWRLSAQLPPDEGALWEKALGVLRDELVAARSGAPDEVTWADAFVALADRSLSPAKHGRSPSERYLTLLHLEAGAPQGRVHLGPALPDALRRLASCDGRIKPIHELQGKPVSVGRSQRIVPKRTRTVVEDRDRGCRVPGCINRRWCEVHHIVHWEDGGRTDLANLVLLCSRHHRMHHRGGLAIAGDPEDPAGLVFTNAAGLRMRTYATPVEPPVPPDQAASRLGVPDGHWHHPSGESMDTKCVWFREPVPI